MLTKEYERLTNNIKLIRTEDISLKVQKQLFETGNYEVLESLVQNPSLIKELKMLKSLFYNKIEMNKEFQLKLLKIGDDNVIYQLSKNQSLIENAYKYNKKTILYSNRTLKSIRKKELIKKSIKFLNKYYKENNLEVKTKESIQKIGYKNLYPFLNDSLIEYLKYNSNLKGFFHQQLGWIVNLPEILDQPNIGSFLLQVKDQDNFVRYISLRKEYYDKYNILKNDLKELDIFSAQKLYELVNNKNIQTSIDQDVLISFFSNMLRYGNYSEKKLIKFSKRVTISKEQKIEPYKTELQYENCKKLDFEITGKRDPINVVLFKVNGCCQQLCNEAENSLYDGLANPNSAFLAVYDPKRKKNSLVAMSWLRLGLDNTLYLDNIEATQSYSQKWVSNLFEEFLIQIKNKFNYKSIVVGKHHSKILFDNKEDVDVDLKNLTKVHINIKKNFYTDLDKGGKKII